MLVNALQVESHFATVLQEQMQYMKGAPALRVPKGPASEFNVFVVHFTGYRDTKDRWMAQYYPDSMLSWLPVVVTPARPNLLVRLRALGDPHAPQFVD